MLRNIYLHGAIKNALNIDSIKLDVDTVPDIFHGLKSANNKLIPSLLATKHISIALVNDDKITYLSDKSLSNRLGSAKEIHIATATTGSFAAFGAWVASAVGATGTAATVVSFAAQTIASIAVSTVLGTIVSKLMTPTQGQESAAEKSQSYMFDGAVNLQGQGHPLPLLYGKFRVGSVTISADISTEKNAVAVDDYVKMKQDETVTGNVFENDIDGSELTVTTWNVNSGTPQTPGATYVDTGLSITLDADGDFSIAITTYLGKFKINYTATSDNTPATTGTILVDVRANPTSYPDRVEHGA